MTCILFPKVVNSGLKRSMMTSSRLRLRGWVKSPTEQTKPLGDVWLAKYLSKPKRKILNRSKRGDDVFENHYQAIRQLISKFLTSVNHNLLNKQFCRLVLSIFCVHLGTVKGWKLKKYQVQLLCCYLTHDNKEIGKYIDHLCCTYLKCSQLQSTTLTLVFLISYQSLVRLGEVRDNHFKRLTWGITFYLW